MTRKPLALAAALAIFAPAAAHAAAPTAADIQTFERSLILAPYTTELPDGRRHVGFAPTVETSAVSCTAEGEVYACTYRSRVRDMFDRDFSEWQTRTERLAWRDKCLVRADAADL